VKRVNVGAGGVLALFSHDSGVPDTDRITDRPQENSLRDLASCTRRPGRLGRLAGAVSGGAQADRVGADAEGGGRAAVELAAGDAVADLDPRDAVSRGAQR